jgi:hypothetical protein
MNANLIYGLFWLLFIGGMLYMHLGHGGHGGMGGMGCGGGHADHSSHQGHNGGAEADHAQTDGPTDAAAVADSTVADSPVTLTKTNTGEPHHHAAS